VAQLEDRLSEFNTGVVETMSRLEGDILLLGVGGKLGPSLARMAKRSSDIAGVRRRVIGVSRFTNEQLEGQLQRDGIETARCDLLNEAQLRQLPQTANVIYLVGRKFGSTGQEGTTWALNSFLPGLVSQVFRHSRIVAYSTGNVYGLAQVAQGGSRETDAPNPVGEYAMSCLGRERVFEYFSRALNIPMTLIRLNYACELRYGVLVDLAKQVWSGQTIDLSMGYFNIIWQGDANAVVLQSFARVSSPPLILNVTGSEMLQVREVCLQFGRIMNRPVTFAGAESPQALLSNSQRAIQWFGPPLISVEQMMRWIAHWVMLGGEDYGKPTHFDSADGRF
jgi:hypothetical protein